MLQQVCLMLGGWWLFSALLWLLVQQFDRHIAGLRRWPGWSGWVALGSLLPFLPWPTGLLNSEPVALLQPSLELWQQLTAVPSHPALPQTLAPQLELAAVLLFVLLLGSGWQGWRLWRQQQLLKGLLKHSVPLDWADVLPAAMLSPFGGVAILRQQVQLRQTPLAISPLFTGLRQPTLLLPGYFQDLPSVQQGLLVQHELWHWQRRDHLSLLLWRVASALAWFNPWLALLEQRFRQAMEFRVDQQLLQQQPQQRLLYAQTLLESLRRNQQPLPCWQPALIQPAQHMAFYQQRLELIFQNDTAAAQPQQRRAIGLLLLLVLLGTVGCNLLQNRPQQWQAPLQQVEISSPFASIAAIRQHKPHQGIDFAASQGTAVFASQSGVVLLADALSLPARYGKVVLLDHGDGYQTLYAHLAQITVRPGQRLNAGQLLGQVGATGKVTGPHLHFELLQHGVQRDPALYLDLL